MTSMDRSGTDVAVSPEALSALRSRLEDTSAQLLQNRVANESRLAQMSESLMESLSTLNGMVDADSAAVEQTHQFYVGTDAEHAADIQRAAGT